MVSSDAIMMVPGVEEMPPIAVRESVLQIRLVDVEARRRCDYCEDITTSI